MPVLDVAGLVGDHAQELIGALGPQDQAGVQPHDPPARGEGVQFVVIDQQNLDTVIEIDGGIDPETIGLAAEAGCDSFVAGSAVFKCDDPAQAVEELRALAARS